jgi:membrane-bound lytic murein transglycosylase F
MMDNHIFRFLASVILGICILFGSACDKLTFRNDLEVIRSRGEIRVVTRNNATCYFEGPHGPSGFEYQMAKAFAEYLKIKLTLVLADSYRDMVSRLVKGEGDLIAGGLTFNDSYRRLLAFGPSYLKVKQQLVGRRGGPQPKNMEDFDQETIWVGAGTSHEETLLRLKRYHPSLAWMTVSKYESEELLEMVWRGDIPLTIADSNIIALNRRYYPELVIHHDIDDGRDHVWAVRRTNAYLLAAVQQWFALRSTKALIDQLSQHYYGHLETFDYVDLTKYHQRLRQRLPRYQKYFEAAAEKYGLDWKLVAAQAYQESHWNPRAKSFTGVRGIMMLTRKTAKDMGVSNRLNVEKSIDAGTRYLAHLHGRFDEAIGEPDRTYMALAAYNIGFGHVEDARTLAVRMGKNKNAWSAVRETLPLLRQKKHYRSLPHGYARGTEPVRYVDRIRTYYQVLISNVEKK